MANKTKKTQKDYFNELLAIESVKGNAELVEFINGRIAQLDKKSASASGKETATQKTNTELKVKILGAMESGKAYTITDLIKSFDFLADLSNQKVSAVVRQMVENDNSVVRTEDKRKAYFTKA